MTTTTITKTKTTVTTVVTVAVLLSALGCARATGFAGAPQSAQCRQSLVDAPPAVGNFQIGGTQYVDPQRCALLFPFRNIYSKTKEKIVGEFRARSCGECAALCAATRYGPGFGLATEIMDSMDPEEAAKVSAIVEKENPSCDSWVWCDPWEVVSDGSCQDKLETDGEALDPFSEDTCVGRWRLGDQEAFTDPATGRESYLQGSTRGCTTESGKVIPAGTCTLKAIDLDKYSDFVQGRASSVETEADPPHFMSGMCDWAFDKNACANDLP